MINGTVRPNGLVPSYLDIGCVPIFLSVDSKLPDQQSRTDALSCACQEMAPIFSKLLVQEALVSRVPRNAELKIEHGAKVLIHPETDEEYVGPKPVIRVEGKPLFVVINDREVKFSVH